MPLEQQAMGSVSSSDTELNEEEKKIIRDTWSVVYSDSIDNGMAILIAFFKKYPSYQSFFNSFKDVPVEDLPNNEKFKAHAQNVMKQLNRAVESLNDLKSFVDDLRSLGQRHMNRGQTPEQFIQLKDTVLEVLKIKFGEAFNPTVEDAWKKTLDILFKTILSVYT